MFCKLSQKQSPAAPYRHICITAPKRLRVDIKETTLASDMSHTSISAGTDFLLALWCMWHEGMWLVLSDAEQPWVTSEFTSATWAWELVEQPDDRENMLEILKGTKKKWKRYSSPLWPVWKRNITNETYTWAGELSDVLKEMKVHIHVSKK